MKKIDTHVNILGVPVFGGTESEVLEMIRFARGRDKSDQPLIVLTPTTEQIVMAQTDDALCDSFQKADINLPDTWGVGWASGLLKQQNGLVIKERLAGVDLAEKITLETLRTGKKVFLLGGKARSAAKAINRFKNYDLRFKTLIESSGGAEDIANERMADKEKVIETIEAFETDLLLVAYGAPWQERWVTENREALGKAGVKVAMVVGGAFDYWAGIAKRAPASWRKAGLEWLWRLFHEPWRWRRQLRLVQFVGMVGREKVRVRG